MRISSTQKEVLLALYALEKKGHTEPVPSMTLFKIINKVKELPVQDTNFRTSCHTLERNQLVNKYRCAKSLKLAWTLTAQGREKAEPYYKSLLKDFKR